LTRYTRESGTALVRWRLGEAHGRAPERGKAGAVWPREAESDMKVGGGGAEQSGLYNRGSLRDMLYQIPQCLQRQVTSHM